MKITRYIQLQLKSNHREYVTLPAQHQAPESAISIIARLNYGRAPYGCVYYLDETCIEYAQVAPEQKQEIVLQYDVNEANRK